MQANSRNFLNHLLGANDTVYRIPVYQRNYDWKQENCKRLITDINNVIETGKPHFVGAIVYMELGVSTASYHQYVIIDGQQRITTMMLLLKALADLSFEKDGENDVYNQINNVYIHNQYCHNDEYRVKLKPISSDNDQFLKLLDNNFDEMDKNSNIYVNYFCCKELLNKTIMLGVSPERILQALKQLEFVEMVLDPRADDPQVIFESINSTGMALTNADLIRNYLLMNADDQDRLYKCYWLNIEKLLSKNSDYKNLNNFFYHYIVFKKNAPLKNTDRIYDEFVKLYTDKNYSKEECLNELTYYAQLYSSFLEPTSYTKVINKLLNAFRLLNQSTCYPFLFHVFDDLKQHQINNDTLEKVLKLFLIYIVRRLVCNLQMNVLKGLFATIYSRVFKIEENKIKYYESFNKFLFTTTQNQMMPSETEFYRCLKENNIYRNGVLGKFLLMEIENGDSKEILDASTLTIEHIMPQTKNIDWQHISDDDHEKYLHVLGNLSVTGYNSELSNRSFEEKKEIIKKNSKATILNSDVVNSTEWTIERIKSRSERLANILKPRFKVVQVEDEDIAFDYLQTIKFGESLDVKGKKLNSCRFENTTYPVSRFADIAIIVLKVLDKKDSSKITAIAKTNYTRSKNNAPWLSTEGLAMSKPFEIRPGIFVEQKLSQKNVELFVSDLLLNFNINKDSISIYFVAEEVEEEADEEDIGL